MAVVIRYRLPDALGGAECRIVRPQLSPASTSGSLYVRVQVGEGDQAFTIDLLRALLTEITPPLPPGTVFTAADAGPFYVEPDRVWELPTGKTWQWSEIYELGNPIPLVRDPFAAGLVELPWRAHIGDDRAILVRARGDQVIVHIEEHGEACTSPVPARAMARALWRAANQTDRDRPEGEPDTPN